LSNRERSLLTQPLKKAVCGAAGEFTQAAQQRLGQLRHRFFGHQYDSAIDYALVQHLQGPLPGLITHLQEKQVRGSFSFGKSPGSHKGGQPGPTAEVLLS
jgi:hypothetical protein